MGIVKTTRTLQDKIMWLLEQVRTWFRILPPDVLRYHIIPYILGPCRIIGCAHAHWVFEVDGRAYTQEWSFGRKITSVVSAPNGALAMDNHRRIIYYSLMISREVDAGLHIGSWLIGPDNWLTYNDVFRIWRVTINAFNSIGSELVRAFPAEPHWDFDPATDAPIHVGERVGKGISMAVIRGRSILALGVTNIVIAQLPERPTFVHYNPYLGTFQPVYSWGSGDHIQYRM